MKNTIRRCALVGGIGVLTGWMCLPAAAGDLAPSVHLAADGRALLPVVVGSAAGEAVKKAAADLADYLGRISGAKFDVAAGDGRQGLAVGLPQDFPQLSTGVKFQPQDPFGQEEYLLRTHKDGGWLLGATEAAVEYAVWDFLYRLGYRQFFPGKNWEVVPRRPDLVAAMDTLQRPSYCSRNLRSWTLSKPGEGGDGDAYAAWMKRNRLGQRYHINSGHMYGRIISDRKKQFDEHPEYRGLVNGKRESSKFCISNPGLRKLVIDYALEYFKNDPEANSISMEPSDGGGWCECAECAKMGSVSDRAATLANEVAEAVSKVYPGKYVGMLAYNQHSAPPNVRIHPRVAITVCAGYLRNGWRPEDLFAGWSKQGGAGLHSVFEYYCDVTNLYRPAGPLVANLTYLKVTIPEFHRRGARMFGSGTSYSNGTVGLGAYVASRLLWDIDEAAHVDAIYQDFLDRAFGSAKGPMDRFYRLVTRVSEEDHRLPRTDVVGRMYSLLDEARRATQDDRVRRRIRDLILYTRYVELCQAYEATPSTAAPAGRATMDDSGIQLSGDAAGGNPRVVAYANLLRYAWRIRETMVVNASGLFSFPKKEIPKTNKHLSAAKNPLKDERPITDEDIDTFLRQGLAANPVRATEYELASFSENLVPAPATLQQPDPPAPGSGEKGGASGRQFFFTWVRQEQTAVKLKIRAGRNYPFFGKVRVVLFWPLQGPAQDKIAPGQPRSHTWISRVGDRGANVVTIDRALLVTSTAVAPDKQEHAVELPTPYRGLHRIEVDDAGGGTQVLPGAEGMAFTAYGGPSEVFRDYGPWSGCFFVPKGTKRLSIYVGTPQGRILDGAGQSALALGRAMKPGYFTVPVPEGQDGRLWTVEGIHGPWRLLNVPPYLARRPSELLLPREVVEADP